MVDCTTVDQARRQLLLGVDGGGSRTRIRIQSTDGQVRADVSAGPTNIRTEGTAPAIRTLREAIDNALSELDASSTAVVAAVLGIAGAGRDEARPALTAWLAELLGDRPFHLASDVALVQAVAGQERGGLVVLAGTGSVVVATNTLGRDAQIGGWGPFIGDPGSGHAIGRAALRAVARDVDGLGPATRLSTLIPAALGLSSVRDLPAVVTSVPDMAALAIDVSAAATMGDAVAGAIFDGAGAELAEQAVEAARQVGWTRSSIPCALAGGVILNQSLVRDAFLRAMEGYGLTPRPLVTVDDPVAGAVRLAGDLIAAHPSTP